MASVRTAVIQATPALFDKAATLDKTSRLVNEAAADGAQLALLPESFIPAYPRGLSFGFVVGSRSEEGRALWQRYWENSVVVPGPDTAVLAGLARGAGLYLSVGVTERDGEFGRGTLYCTQLLFGPDGALLDRHRKLKPTGSERLIWGEGDGSTLSVVDTPLGRTGALICWENYMPLARMALYTQGVQLYLAPTADAREQWQATLRHIALEGRCFVLGCNQFVRRDDYPADLPLRHELADQPPMMSRGGSVIISPLGDVLAGPLWDEEGILCAELDLDLITRAKLDFDVAGHYGRPDIFRLEVDRRPRPPVDFEF